MENTHVLAVAMANKCKRLIQNWDTINSELPKALQQKHLIWMCRQIEHNAQAGPATKLHRWLGFIQGAMLANRMLDLDELKAMFDGIKLDHEESCEDLESLLDHLDPMSSFEFDIGGQG